jgi:carboxymethylenebutenolidase
MRDRNDAEAAIVAETDPRLATSRATFTGATGEVGAYLAMPADTLGPLPAIGVFHDDCGLGEHIEDVTRRLALAGFVVIAPDFLSPHGGTPASDADARRLIGEAGAAETIGDAVAAIRFLEAHPATTGKVGVTGSCWGGDLVHRAAIAVPELGAAVAWHGNPPPAEEAASVQAALMLHHAERDPRTDVAVTAYAAALEAAGVTHTLFVYEGVDEAFEDDTNEARYDPTAAALAWQRTIDFFQAKLAA